MAGVSFKQHTTQLWVAGWILFAGINMCLTFMGCLHPTEKPLSQPASPDDNSPLVYHLLMDQVSEVSSGKELQMEEIPDQLIIPPGNYNFLGKAYALEQEGLYRFLLPGKFNAQRIVFREDLDALLSAIAWIVTHGNSDDGLPGPELTEKALHSKLFLTCGDISKWAHHLLSGLGLPARPVAGITLEDWNDYDNSHLLIEVWRNRWSKWVLYDLDNNAWFVPEGDSIPYSLIEFSRAVAQNNFRVIRLASDTRLDVSNFVSDDGYSYGFFAEQVNTNLRDWYRRVMQLPLVFDEDRRKYVFMDREHQEKVEGYSSFYQYIEGGEFMQKFYPTN